MARELVLAHGWNSTAYQVLNPGIEHWFSRGKAAVVGYAQRGAVLLVAGEPVSSLEALPEVSREFEAFASRRGCRVCYVCAGHRMRALFAESPAHSAIALGAQPVWEPPRWRAVVEQRAEVRHQVNRARNKNVDVEAVDPDQVARNPELGAVLNEWVRARPLPPLHFLAEPNVIESIRQDHVVLVARRDGQAVAFLVASPIPARNGYLVELLARSHAAPNGTSELLIDAAMRQSAERGVTYLTLGLVALAHAADPEIRRNPFWVRSLMHFARAHANRFYSFRGLEYFRTKLAPAAWEPVYAISNERKFSARTLYSVGAAFSSIPPWLAIGLGVARAARAEYQSVSKTFHGWVSVPKSP